MAAIHPWEEVAYTDDQGKPKLKPKHQEALDKAANAEDTAEQYALIAANSGMYVCNCPGGTYFLNIGEVWKYGITKNGEKGRYTVKFLTANNLHYESQFIGTLHDCLIQEQIKIRSYSLLPENVARPIPERLVRPCGNSKNF